MNAIIKKIDAWRIEMVRVDGGVSIDVRTDPLLVASFKKAVQSNNGSGISRSRSLEVLKHTTEDQTYVYIPRSAHELVEDDKSLAPFVFSENPIAVVCPIMRTNEQLAAFGLRAKSFIARWYESRLKPVTVTATVTVTSVETVE